jgi:hypothetical protein
VKLTSKIEKSKLDHYHQSSRAENIEFYNTLAVGEVEIQDQDAKQAIRAIHTKRGQIHVAVSTKY